MAVRQARLRPEQSVVAAVGHAAGPWRLDSQTGPRSMSQQPATSARAVIFDLDGVLLDSAGFHRRAWYRLAAELGAEMTDAFFAETFGQPNFQILPRLLGRPVEGAELRRLSERKEALYRQEAHGRLRLFDGAEELFEDLIAAGFRRALGSSTPLSNLDFLRAELGLDRWLEAFVSGDEVRRGKPDPEVFLLAAERLGVPPARCVVLEDAPAGLEAARAGGMRAVGLATTHPAERLPRFADLVVASLGQLSAERLAGLFETRGG